VRRRRDDRAPGPVGVGVLRHRRRRGPGRSRWPRPRAAPPRCVLRRGRDPDQGPRDRRRHRHPPDALSGAARTAARVVPHQPSEGDVPHAPGTDAAAPGGQPHGDVTESTRPFPPGSYPVVVIGSGPGGIQVSYALRRNGIEHAVISEDPSPGGMFRRWPHFQRLLSWTKPHAPDPVGSRAYERYDWNSLLADEPEARALQPGLMDGTSYFPSRPEMEQNLGLSAERPGIAIRYGCRWTATRRIDDAEGGGFVVETTDGEYRAPVLVVAVGVAEPYSPPGIGMELTHHYAEVRPAESYAGHRVLMLGKQNSGFELANGLLPWACSIALVSPSPAKFSVQTNSLAGVRARYVQPYEDFVLGGGVAVLKAGPDRIARTEGGDGSLTVHLRRTDNGNELAIEVDDVISATGFVSPLLDLPDI